jgi:hypothetical protein
MLLAGLKPAIPTSKRGHTHALDRATTGIDNTFNLNRIKLPIAIIISYIPNQHVLISIPDHFQA